MSNVNNISGSTPIQKIIAPAVQKQVSAEAPKQIRANDKVELSGLSHLLATLKKNDIRADKVASVRAQLAAGTYNEDQKLDAATGPLLDDLLK